MFFSFFLQARRNKCPSPARINWKAPPSHSAVVASTPLGTRRDTKTPTFIFFAFSPPPPPPRNPDKMVSLPFFRRCFLYCCFKCGNEADLPISHLRRIIRIKEGLLSHRHMFVLVHSVPLVYLRFQNMLLEIMVLMRWVYSSGTL